MKKPIIIAAVIAVAAVLAIAVIRRTPVAATGLKVSGSIEATTVQVSFKVAGRLDKRLVDEGDVVKTGQPVALLHTNEFVDEKNARSSEARASRAALADLVAGSRKEELTQAEAVLARMKAEADRMAKEFARAEALFKREVIPLKELDAARAGRDSSTAAVREAEERLKLLRIGPRPDAVNQARARVDAATAVLALAETRLADTSVASPVAGLVLAKHAEPGEMLAPGAPVVTIGKLDEVWLKAYIPETELGRVKVGQPVRVTSDTWPGRAYEGKITFISPQAEFTPKNVQTEKERVKLVYRIKITLPNPKMELKPGMPADATIETGVPRQ
ncbi:efflux RND transporter periplasmic adaptor subunit [Geobacter pelophilus]|uniref:Efflux RND transporter periplasmic adaptor subunit n=1 Tax=Geoanaerobacter pelophilus TaxID=60036 RepID=A0AAW4L9Q5_9BACT|nr:efflux RND transporter periplasmic adaptor subunit [Geoanaerobacter pelophilus]MBT0666320.1 efflux RND transporter periplasmic adaptor subunit [Geoanaerobacter pelophilus]